MQMRQEYPEVDGVVELWHEDEGWGVLRAPDGLSVFCHFSHILMDGYRTLTAGDRVRFNYETPGQDGCDARVVANSSARPLRGD